MRPSWRRKLQLDLWALPFGPTQGVAGARTRRPGSSTCSCTSPNIATHHGGHFCSPQRRSGARARAGISDLEVGYSARNAREWDRLVGALDVLELIETTAAHVLRAKQVQRHLASKSQRGRKIPDLLIAAAAEAERLTVLHYDQDFDMISKITGQPCQWVVSAGTID